MNNWLKNLIPVYPELLLTVTVFLTLLLELFVSTPRRSRILLLTSVAGLLLAALLCLAFWVGQSRGIVFSDMFVLDPLASLLKMFAYVMAALSLLYMFPYMERKGLAVSGEIYHLFLFAVLGISFMISANHLLLVYVGLELMSLSLYAMVAVDRNNILSTEASIKYFVLGAIASGLLLYGFSMLYGATGGLSLKEIATALADPQRDRHLALLGLVFVVAGLAFKLGVVPFHMWVPDVYQGSPTSITLMIASIPKLAAFAITLRILISGLNTLSGSWQEMLVGLSVLSLLVGNIGAIAQSHIKRMLAYSTIAQMGFMLLGLSVGFSGGNSFSALGAYSASLFYVIVYVLMTVAIFAVILLLTDSKNEIKTLADLRGLSQHNPSMAFILLLLMFSMAGIPPTVGFYAKLVVLQAIINSGMITLAVIAVLLSLVGAFYYLRIIQIMYFEDPPSGDAHSHLLPSSSPLTYLLLFHALVLFALGIFPDYLLQMCFFAIGASI